MPSYDVTSPEGKKYRVNAPDGATHDQVLAYAKQKFSKPIGETKQEKPSLLEAGVKGAYSPFKPIIDRAIQPAIDLYKEGQQRKPTEPLPGESGGQFARRAIARDMPEGMKMIPKAIGAAVSALPSVALAGTLGQETEKLAARAAGVPEKKAEKLGQDVGDVTSMIAAPRALGKTTEKISSAAIKDGKKIYTGSDHEAIRQKMPEGSNKGAKANTGFVTNKGRFVSREEADKIAKKQGQFKQEVKEPDALHSEELKNPAPPARHIPPKPLALPAPAKTTGRMIAGKEGIRPEREGDTTTLTAKGKPKMQLPKGVNPAKLTPAAVQKIKKMRAEAKAPPPAPKAPPAPPQFKEFEEQAKPFVELDEGAKKKETKNLIDTLVKHGNRIMKINMEKVMAQDKWLKQIPAKLWEKFYLHAEDEKGVPLTPEEKEIFDRTGIKQEMEGNKQRHIMLNKYDPETYPLYDEGGYVHRIRKGKGFWRDEDSGGSPGGGRSLAKVPASEKTRVYYTMEDAAGNRSMVSLVKQPGREFIGKGGKEIQDKPQLIMQEYKGGKPVGKGSAVAMQGQPKPGQKYTMPDGRTVTVKTATTPEIEQNEGGRYFKNLALSVSEQKAGQLKAMANIEFLENLKKRYINKGMAVKGKSNPDPKRFDTVDPLQLRGIYFDRMLAEPINDFYNRYHESIAALEKINNFMFKTMFINPLPHDLNITTDYLTSRGFENFTSVPKIAEGWRDVSEYSPFYQKMLDEGAALQYPSAMLARAYTKVNGQLIKEMKESGQLKDIAKAWGLTPGQALDGMMSASQSSMWKWGDALMAARVRELMGKGMSMQQAIKQAEEVMNTYRMPPRVLGSRYLALLLDKNPFFIFNRYHYNRLKAYAVMTKKLTVGTPKQRAEALGQLAAMSVLTYLYIQKDKLIAQAGYGNKIANATAPRGYGMTALPMAAYNIAQGTRKPSSIKNSMFSESPLTGLLFNPYASNPIKAIQENVAPFNMFHDDLGRTAIENLGGPYIPTDKQADKYERKQEKGQ